MDNFKDYQPPDEEEERRLLEKQAEERAARSDAQWWEEDHLSGPKIKQLTEALDDLQEGCGCEIGRLLNDLREIERLSGGYAFFLGRRELPQIIKRTRELAKDFERIELSPLSYNLRDHPDQSGRLLLYADALEKARQATRRTARPQGTPRCCRASLRYSLLLFEARRPANLRCPREGHQPSSWLSSSPHISTPYLHQETGSSEFSAHCPRHTRPSFDHGC